jgi:hypothetical protein
MTATAIPQRDRLLRHEKDLYTHMPRGVPFYDFLPRVPAPCLTRRYTTAPHETRIMDCEPGVILCAGAAVGLDRQGIVQHIRSYHDLQGFVGFVEKTISRGKVLIRTRGDVAVRISATAKPGDKVFCANPDEFELTSEGYEVGRILFVQPERPDLCCVAFKAFNDSRPLDLNVAGR